MKGEVKMKVKNMTAQEIVAGLQKIVPEGMIVKSEKVTKDGEEMTGIMVFRSDSQGMAPTVYLERLPDVTLELLSDALVKAAEKVPEFDPRETLLNREYFLQNVRPVLVNKNRVNPDVITFDFAGDVAIALEVTVGSGTTKVTDALLNEVQLAPALALERAKRNLKPCVTPFDPFGDRNFGLQNLIGSEEMPDNYNPMLIVSDERLLTLESWHGAAAILDRRATETVSRFFGESFMVLPSSIHEVLCVPRGMMEASELRGMVSAINSTEVDPQDRLSDNVFIYENGAFRVA